MKISLAVLMSLNFLMACDLKNFISELKDNNKPYIIHKENRAGIEDLKARQKRIDHKYSETYRELHSLEQHVNIKLKQEVR
ncbi:MAG: Unknown protein [uncultured Sulfurovum sp.]|uniref:Lipoprotein n=1 Tax=uncultured Sulfurovum sp. TaxID=269237 RepID=A0A6S6SNZ8_9BACT|nr:MAG: Unknown protein [uncultured Sulfurovum sp.]